MLCDLSCVELCWRCVALCCVVSSCGVVCGVLSLCVVLCCTVFGFRAVLSCVV